MLFSTAPYNWSYWFDILCDRVCNGYSRMRISQAISEVVQSVNDKSADSSWLLAEYNLYSLTIELDQNCSNSMV